MPGLKLCHHLSPRLVTHHDLCDVGTNSDPSPVLARLSGDFAPAMATVFPDEWAWAALATPVPTRQIWYAVFSGLPAQPSEPAILRRNLLSLNAMHLLRLRFQGLAEPMHGILTRLFPTPLPRYCYARLADILTTQPAAIAHYAGQTGEIDSTEFAEMFQD